jgi:hypothetical protein
LKLIELHNVPARADGAPGRSFRYANFKKLFLAPSRGKARCDDDTHVVIPSPQATSPRKLTNPHIRQTSIQASH